ncbi:LOW QUALITY PROTEIN: RING finger protein 215-like [Saccoglossus kowalevskii]
MQWCQQQCHDLFEYSALIGQYQLPLDCDSNEDRLLYNTQGWIGVFYLTSPSTEYEDLNPDKPCCSLVDRVKEVMLFGASALILLANVDTHIWMQLDVSQLFTKPIIVINETKHIMKFMGFLQKSEKSSLRSKITFDSTFYDLQPISRITLWSTCGRARGGGTVCMDSPISKTQKPHSSWWYILLSTLTLCAFFILLRSPQQFRIPDVEESLQQVAQQVLSKMKTRCYSHKKRRHKHDRGDDTCPICLEKYFPKQMIRVLPCFHEYHVKCVDSWLIQQRTCPLCKLNIIETRICMATHVMRSAVKESDHYFVKTKVKVSTKKIPTPELSLTPKNSSKEILDPDLPGQ